MNTVTLLEATDQLSALCDAALQGRPTVIDRDGHLVILQAYEVPEDLKPKPLGYFADCYNDPEEIELENQCARASD